MKGAPMMTLLSALSAAVCRDPDQVALKFGDRSVTYGSLDRASDVGAEMLAAHGIGAGDRVIVLLPNVPQFVVAALSAYKRQAVVVPLNPLLRGGEVAGALADCGARLVVTWPGADDAGLKVLGQAAPVIMIAGTGGPFGPEAIPSGPRPAGATARPSDLAALLYTSATTGTAKGVMLSHESLWAGADAFRQVFGLTSADTQVALVPLFHALGMTVVLNASLLAGCTVVLEAGRFQPSAALDLIASSGVTVVVAVTPMFASLLAEYDSRAEVPDLSRVRLVGGGAASIPPDLADRLVRAFGAKIGQGWGLTEAAPGCYTGAQDGLLLGDIGCPMPGTQIRVVDDHGRDLPVETPGELWLRGRAVMTGYFGNPRATSEAITDDGWLRTGDIGRLRADGGYTFVGRIKEVIKRSGFNIYPAEVEAALMRHPDVRLAAVLGVPDAERGEEVAAAVIRRGAAPLDLGELQQWIKEQVAPYKYPRLIVEVDELPLAASGKVLKRAIDVNALFGPIPSQ